jgi:hypothetical protein
MEKSLPSDTHKILAELEDMARKAEEKAESRPERDAGKVAAAKVQKPGAKSEESPRQEKKHRPATDQPAAASDSPPVEPRVAESPSPDARAAVKETGSSAASDQPDRMEKSLPSDPSKALTKLETRNSRSTDQALVKKIDKSVEPPKLTQQPVEPPTIPLQQIQSFIRAYCNAYENLNYLRFMGFFTPDAVENDTSIRQLETTYRNNFERLDALTYEIQVKGCHVKPGEIEVTGDYRLRWRFREDEWRAREGAIVLSLIPVKGSFQVKRLAYR